MSYQAGEVATKLLGRTQTDLRTITAERAAETCFRDLGYMPMTRGSKRHEMVMLVIDTLPLLWFQKIFYGMSIGTLKKMRISQGEY